MPFVLLALLSVLLLLAASYGAFRFAFYNSPRYRADPYDIPKGEQYQKNRDRMLALIRSFDQIPFEPVSILSHDGLRLYGRYYHVRDGAPLQIQFHGYRGTALRDFCGGNKLAREDGQNTLVVDQRANGQSQGRIITMGVKERLDCLAWARYAAERFGPDCPILLSGVSMGAATVLMASNLALPRNVRGIIADCPYSSPGEIVRKVAAGMPFPLSHAYPFLALGARLFGGFRLSTPGAADAVKETNIPILLIHGEDDRYVPCDMSRKIAAAGSDIRLETFPKAGHGLSYMEDRPRYERVVREFLKHCGIK